MKRELLNVSQRWRFTRKCHTFFIVRCGSLWCCNNSIKCQLCRELRSQLWKKPKKETTNTSKWKVFPICRWGKTDAYANSICLISGAFLNVLKVKKKKKGQQYIIIRVLQDSRVINISTKLLPPLAAQSQRWHCMNHPVQWVSYEPNLCEAHTFLFCLAFRLTTPG